LPARYAAYLAQIRIPGAEDAILGEQSGDEDRNFLFPVHKLFDGDECLKNTTIRLTFSERHRNEKLGKFHSETGMGTIAMQGRVSNFSKRNLPNAESPLSTSTFGIGW